VSLVPSITELLYDLGLGDRIVGKTNFCTFPEKGLEHAELIGGTKNPDIQQIEALSPDLVLAIKEENRKEDVEHIRVFAPVFTGEVTCPADALSYAASLASVFYSTDEVQLFLSKLEEGYGSIKEILPSKKVVYLIWKKPLMSVGGDTYIHAMLEHLGLKNVLCNEARYPQIEESFLSSDQVDVILLSTEPFRFSKAHVQEFQKRHPEKSVFLVDGAAFSWFGSRILHCQQEFEQLRKFLEKE
jgi:ABC-type Fe3+-hydroxamate transport system substrate-binding protein